MEASVCRKYKLEATACRKFTYVRKYLPFLLDDPNTIVRICPPEPLVLAARYLIKSRFTNDFKRPKLSGMGIYKLYGGKFRDANCHRENFFATRYIEDES